MIITLIVATIVGWEVLKWGVKRKFSSKKRLSGNDKPLLGKKFGD